MLFFLQRQSSQWRWHFAARWHGQAEEVYIYSTGEIYCGGWNGHVSCLLCSSAHFPCHLWCSAVSFLLLLLLALLLFLLLVLVALLPLLFLFFLLLLALPLLCSPWYNRNGWLGVKHQVTDLLASFCVVVGAHSSSSSHLPLLPSYSSSSSYSSHLPLQSSSSPSSSLELLLYSSLLPL